MKYCEFCGNSLEDDAICNCSEAIKKHEKNKKSLKMGLCIGIPVFFVVLTLVLVIGLMKINPSTYLGEPVFNGYNTMGTANISFDREGLIIDIIGEAPENWFGEEFVEWQNAYDDYSSGIKLEYKSEGLSNGDEITVKITTSGVAAEKIKSIELTYVVEGLEEIETVDVFSNIAVTFSGVSGNGTLKYELLSDNNILNSCRFKISHNDDLKNGDTVTLTITNTSFIFDKYKVVPIQTSKEYTVYSLSEWANKDSIPLSLFQEFANSFVSEENEDISQSSGGGFTYSEAELYGIYYFSKKEDVVFASANEVHIIVSYDRYFGGEHDMTIYVPLRYENLILDSEGKVNVAYDDGERSSFFHTDIDKYFDNYENAYNIEKLN